MVPAFVPQQVPPSQWGCNTQDLLLIHGIFRNTLQRLPARLMYKLAGKGNFEQEWRQLYGD